MWENTIKMDKVREIRGKVSVVLGNGAIEKTFDVLKEIKKNHSFHKIIIVTGRSAYKKTGAWDHVEKALKKHHISYVLFDKISPNPTSDEVDEAVKLAIETGANGVIGIGGGSPIDAAKIVAIMTLYPEYSTSELFDSVFEPKNALPILAINTTHGTGSETNRFAVLSIKDRNFKIGIGYEFLYPKYSIDDPKLMVSLSKGQTAYTTIDALNHVLEACTSFLANPLVILMAKEVVRLIAKYLPQALEDGENLQARYCLTYAAMIAGMSFDNSTLHLTHALEHPMSAIKTELPHGLGLAVLLPAVIRETYPKKAEILAEILQPIVPDLKGLPNEAKRAAEGVKNWLISMGISDTLTTLGIGEEKLEQLVDLVYKTPGNPLLLYCSPVPVTRDLIESIYRNSL
ncbi:MAG: alcohol dehydrogenase [Firmicutes bacterium HGW-Firmicutes-1]|jgi:alcohol dehydrogenase class IV|nr:MAG: alcohol dehydrogenase [Firmicutes bacterium HGW-Firmicutes-1]